MVTSDHLRMPDAEVANCPKLAPRDRRKQRLYLMLGTPLVYGIEDVIKRNTVPSDTNGPVLEPRKALRQFDVVDIHRDTFRRF